MTRKKKTQLEPDPLLPCPLCGTPNPTDLGYGITCNHCSLWLGTGTRAQDLGGYRTVWNTRAGLNKEH